MQRSLRQIIGSARGPDFSGVVLAQMSEPIVLHFGVHCERQGSVGLPYSQVNQRWRVALTRRSFLLTLAAAPILPLPLMPAAAFRDRDCDDFPTWKKAQRFFKKHGGPRKDPHRLDGDNDGIACEDLR